jgi:DNA-binding PadR family transcriptional regulator
MTPSAVRGPVPGRVLGLYALATMERDGPTYGYALAERIAVETEGAWRPGPGAIYPALNALVERGDAHVRRQGRRRVYAISAQGRATLARIRKYFSGAGAEAPDLSRLWAVIHGSGDPGAHLLRHLHRHLDSLLNAVERDPLARAGDRSLRDEAIAELAEAVRRLRRVRVARGRGGTEVRHGR